MVKLFIEHPFHKMPNTDMEKNLQDSFFFFKCKKYTCIIQITLKCKIIEKEWKSTRYTFYFWSGK